MHNFSEGIWVKLGVPIFKELWANTCSFRQTNKPLLHSKGEGNSKKNKIKTTPGFI